MKKFTMKFTEDELVALTWCLNDFTQRLADVSENALEDEHFVDACKLHFKIAAKLYPTLGLTLESYLSRGETKKKSTYWEKTTREYED